MRTSSFKGYTQIFQMIKCSYHLIEPLCNAHTVLAWRVSLLSFTLSRLQVCLARCQGWVCAWFVPCRISAIEHPRCVKQPVQLTSTFTQHCSPRCLSAVLAPQHPLTQQLRATVPLSDLGIVRDPLNKNPWHGSQLERRIVHYVQIIVRCWK